MNIEEVRTFALSLHEGVTEELFADHWISFRVEGKWFLLMQLDAPEPRVAVKMRPEVAQELREQHDGVRPAYHMNKAHWSDLYLEQMDGTLVRQCIRESYQLIVSRLPKASRAKYGPQCKERT